MSNIVRLCRQPYLDEQSYKNTLQQFAQDYEILATKIIEQADNPRDKAALFDAWADQLWCTFQLRFTAGDNLEDLAHYLSKVVEAYERYVEARNSVPANEYRPPFVLDLAIDIYVDYLNLLSAAVLLHREDLLPRICALNEGTEYDKSDAVIEEIFFFYLPDRPTLDGWFWKAYTPILDAIDQDTPADRAKAMGKFVKGWYKSMKGVAHFWGKHEEIKPEFSPYFGYWAMCAAAFTYLYDIDDSKYRDELVYPKDLVDFARKKPRQLLKLKDGRAILRVLGGQRCPESGQWFSPAKEDSTRHFRTNELMPTIEFEYGQIIWQLLSADSK